MKRITIDIGKDFAKWPGTAFASDGHYSGEEFRNIHLIPALAHYDRVIVILDNVEAYSASFLSEAFGGLISHGLYTAESLLSKLDIVYSHKDYKFYQEITIEYIKNAKYKSSQNIGNSRPYSIPKPPCPPPKRVQCGNCGYTESEDKYSHTCYLGLSVVVFLGLLVVIPVAFLLSKLF